MPAHDAAPRPGDDTDLDRVADAVLEGSRALVAMSARSVAAARGVTSPQYRMLAALESGSSNLTALAHHLAVAPSTAMRMVDRLVCAGLVSREVRPENRRETRLELTADGRRTVRRVTDRRRRDLRALLGEIAVDDRRGLAHAMRALAAAVDRWGPAAGP